jgi:hypothetical protein
MKGLQNRYGVGYLWEVNGGDEGEGIWSMGFIYIQENVYIHYIYIYIYTHTHTHTQNGVLLSHKEE